MIILSGPLGAPDIHWVKVLHLFATARCWANLETKVDREMQDEYCDFEAVIENPITNLSPKDWSLFNAISIARHLRSSEITLVAPLPQRLHQAGHLNNCETRSAIN